MGDVIYTLPMATLLKEKFPDCEISFLVRDCNKAIIEMADDVDHFISLDDLRGLPEEQAVIRLRETGATDFIHVMPDKDLARIVSKAGIKRKIGTVRRPYHVRYCNKLIWASRSHDDKHEIQFTTRMLSPYGVETYKDTDFYASKIKLSAVSCCPEKYLNLINKSKFTVVLHPGSNGHAKEWPISRMKEFIEKLDPQQYQVFISGLQSEKEKFNEALVEPYSHVDSLMGALTLLEFADFIVHSDVLIASSTGPLHLSSLLGQNTVGVFPDIGHLDVTRWGALGPNTINLTSPIVCDVCQSYKVISHGQSDPNCTCMYSITAEDVYSSLKTLRK